MQDMTATYSPEDNKLRLYSVARLDPETYARVRAAGFIWAPKQGLFVAPMWTPDRADLLEELACEIGDEDTSLADRAEQRADRFSDYEGSRRQDAEQAHKAVAAIADNIPFGQPILVGHHSERHARKDAERIENGMRRAVKMWETADYWKQRAAGAIRAAKYKELPGVRARRIKGLEADKRKRERAKAEALQLLKLWEGKAFARMPKTGERRPIEITEEHRAFLHDVLGSMAGSGVSVRGKDGQSWFSAYDMTAPDGERYKNCPDKTVAEIQAIALRLQTEAVAHCDRWLDHIENRLAYERAMLDDAGGMATDRNKPEKGGACRCWASHRGAWSWIVKVNRVSVTVLDNWGNAGQLDGAHNFTRNIPFDKLAKVMSAAEVNAAREAGRLHELPDKTGFMLSADQPAEPTTTGEAQAAAIVADHREAFDKMRESLAAGVQVVTAPQLFPTPPALAARMAELAEVRPDDRVLEPSAGIGNLIAAVWGNYRGTFAAVEINPQLANELRRRFPAIVVDCCDFLTCNGDLGAFDRILMNPPFANGADIKHIMHARHMLKPGGRLVAICADGPRQREQLQPIATHWEDLPAGTFAEQGTNVNTALLVIQN